MRRIACVLGWCSLWLPVPAQAQLLSGLLAGAMFDDYYHVAYVDLPTQPARHVFFTGEPIVVRLTVANLGPAQFEVDTQPTIRDAFPLTATLAPPEAPPPFFVPEQRSQLLINGSPRPAQWQPRFQLVPNSEVRVHAILAADSPMVPGRYEYHVTFGGTSTVPIRMVSAILRFEVRDVTNDADRAEVIRRRMVGAFTYDALRDAEAEADRLLSIHPTSLDAYRVKAAIAARQGRTAEAEVLLERAKTIAVTEADQLWFKQVGSAGLARAAQEVDTDLSAVRQGSPRRP